MTSARVFRASRTDFRIHSKYVRATPTRRARARTVRTDRAHGGQRIGPTGIGFAWCLTLLT